MKHKPVNSKDWRNIKNGLEIPSLAYCDQPYFIKTDDDAWLFTLTTGKKEEGNPSQNVYTIRTKDGGKTWEDHCRMEPQDSPENSYSVLLKTNFGRIYCFYNYNADNLRKIPADDPPYEDGYNRRMDSLGQYVFRYSDDHGKSWSKRHRVPIRNFDIDRNNVTGGKIQFFWNVGKPLPSKNHALISIHKVGGFGEGFFTKSEGVLIKITDIMNETDVEGFTYETLPLGEKGIKGPGAISEEHSYVFLSDGSIFCVFRTTLGHPYYSRSKDDGKTWSTPNVLCYEDKRPIKHPRAANFIWKLEKDRYLYWFHNNGGKGYEHRNPAWVIPVVEKKTKEGIELQFKQPEIFLYDDQQKARISYPDLLTDGQDLYVSQTQKSQAKVQKVPHSFIQRLFNDYDASVIAPYRETLPEDEYADITLDFSFENQNRSVVLLENIDEQHNGIQIRVDDGKRIVFDHYVDQQKQQFVSDSSVLQNGSNCVTIIIDQKAHNLRFVVNEKCNDGGDERMFGWYWLEKPLQIRGDRRLKCGKPVKSIRIYEHALLTKEVCSNHRCERMENQ